MKHFYLIILASSFGWSNAQINFKEDFEGVLSSKIITSTTQSSHQACNGLRDRFNYMDSGGSSHVTYLGGTQFNSNKVTIKFKARVDRDTSGPYYVATGYFKVEYKINGGNWIEIKDIPLTTLMTNQCNEYTAEIPSNTIKRGDDVSIRLHTQAYMDQTSTIVSYTVKYDDFEILQDYKENIIFAEANATGDGSSWDNPMDLADALVWAQKNSSKGLWTESDPLKIWAKKGTYFPKYDIDKNSFGEIPVYMIYASFYLPHNVKLFGSFEGNETTLSERILPNDRNYESILSGDFNQDDVVKDLGNQIQISNTTDNAFHVLIAELPSTVTSSATELNGFTIKGANARSASSVGTIYNILWDTNGGAIYAVHSKAQFNNLKIANNVALNYGAGLFNSMGDIKANNILVVNNVAENGAGIVNDRAKINLSRSIISKNYAMMGNGGFYSNNSDPSYNSTSVITNVLIDNNYSKVKGGVGIEDNLFPYYFTNTTLVGHDFEHNIIGDVKFRNSIVWDGLPTAVEAEYSLIKNRESKDNGNIDASPYEDIHIFVDPMQKDYHLKLSSPAKDNGIGAYYSPNAVPNIITFKSDVDGTLIDIESVDMGAYQYTTDLDVKDIKSNKSKAYPVPFKDQITILNSEVIKSIEIFDVLGRSILTKSVNDKSVSLPTDTLKKGFYILKLNFSNRTETINVVK